MPGLHYVSLHTQSLYSELCGLVTLTLNWLAPTTKSVVSHFISDHHNLQIVTIRTAECLILKHFRCISITFLFSHWPSMGSADHEWKIMKVWQWHYNTMTLWQSSDRTNILSPCCHRSNCCYAGTRLLIDCWKNICTKMIEYQNIS